MRIFLFLVLVDLEHMVSSMCRDQPASCVFLQIGVEFAEEFAKVFAINRQTGESIPLLVEIAKRSPVWRVPNVLHHDVSRACG